MLKSRILFSVFLMGFYFPSFSQETHKINETVKIATQEWEPYQFKKENGEIGGIATDVIKKVLGKMNVKYEIQIYPWARAQENVKSGASHGFYAASQSQDRDAYAVMTDTIAHQKWYWYFKANSKIDPSNSEFKKNAKVGAVMSSNMSKYLKDNSFNVTAQPVTMDQVVKMLENDRIDSALVNDLSMIEYMKNNNFDEAKYNKFLAQDKPLKTYFNKQFTSKYPWFIDEFNKNLKEMVIK